MEGWPFWLPSPRYRDCSGFLLVRVLRATPEFVEVLTGFAFGQHFKTSRLSSTSPQSPAPKKRRSQGRGTELRHASIATEVIVLALFQHRCPAARASGTQTRCCVGSLNSLRDSMHESKMQVWTVGENIYIYIHVANATVKSCKISASKKWTSIPCEAPDTPGFAPSAAPGP